VTSSGRVKKAQYEGKNHRVSLFVLAQTQLGRTIDLCNVQEEQFHMDDGDSISSLKPISLLSSFLLGITN
jgi:hypothetical protein